MGVHHAGLDDRRRRLVNRAAPWVTARAEHPSWPRSELTDPLQRVQDEVPEPSVVGWVRSSPTIVTGHRSPNTICAASGSVTMLDSAAAVRMPPATAPPMSTTSA